MFQRALFAALSLVVASRPNRSRIEAPQVPPFTTPDVKRIRVGHEQGEAHELF